MTLQRITDWSARLTGRLFEQFKGATTWAEFVAVLAPQVQELEDAIFDVLAVTSIDSSAGVQLDGIGTMVGEGRRGELDAAYRPRLRAAVLANLSSGSHEEILSVISALVYPDALRAAFAEWVAEFAMTIAAPVLTPTIAAHCLDFMERSMVGGVHGVLEWQETVDWACFILVDQTHDGETSTTTGLGDATDPTIGGALVGAEEV